MTAISNLTDIVEQLRQSNIEVIDKTNTLMINNMAMDILSLEEHTADQLILIGLIVNISNILYNNTDRSLLPLEDGVYDLLFELYKRYNPSFQIGAESIIFEASTAINKELEAKNLRNVILISELEDMIFEDELTKTPEYTLEDMLHNGVFFGENISNRIIDTEHMYPELVGTLDKCKFVLNNQAMERGVFDDSNVKVFERDFIQEHISMGIIEPNEVFTMVLELKYDGISVEAEVSNKILSARSRGDTNNNIGADLTPILAGYKFNKAKSVPEDEIFGMKFEAIINNYNLSKLSQLKDREYKNPRNAIIGLFGSSDAMLYRDYITLVPLATSLHLDRITEIEFMNKYYNTGEYLRYAVVTGNYMDILFQVKRFVEEAEYMRTFMPFMYDGIVVSYVDEEKIKSLGRSNSVNKYSVAIKFNAMKKQTIFNGYTFNVGSNGAITPMIHYNPVEFYGTIHTKSTGHSYARFKELNLKVGDIIDVEYTNDVMPYITKPDNSSNASNELEVESFIDKCPSCGNTLKITQSGKSIICDNIKCPERNIARMVNMLQKLNLKDFSEESLKLVAKFSLSELFSLSKKDVEALGPNNSQIFIDKINELKINPIFDYKIIGSLGFTGIGRDKWKLILNKISIDEILASSDEELKIKLLSIKGIGPSAVDTICTEREFFMNDLVTIMNLPLLLISKNTSSSKSIRFSGVRDANLVLMLSDMGLDVNDNAGVTKTTDILITPYDGYTSSKTSKAGPNTIIVSIDDFKANIDKYCL